MTTRLFLQLAQLAGPMPGKRQGGYGAIRGSTKRDKLLSAGVSILLFGFLPVLGAFPSQSVNKKTTQFRKGDGDRHKARNNKPAKYDAGKREIGGKHRGQDTASGESRQKGGTEKGKKDQPHLP